MRDRIFGIETEYAPAYRWASTPFMADLDGEELLNRMQELTATALDSLDQADCTSGGEFLSNGGRLYMDRGGHPEYATPECRSILDLITYEKAGDRLIRELFAQQCDIDQDTDSAAKLHVFKNNVDFYGNTYGSHENYLVTERVTEQVSTILPFLVTRQIYAGAGKTELDTGSGRLLFRISQRADFFDRVYSDRTSEVRGIINTRRREIPRHGKNRRLHIIIGDSNLCEAAMAIKVGATHLVLRVLEENSWGNLPALRSPVTALKKIARDPLAPVELDGKRGRWTAIEIQREHLEKVRRFFISHSPSPEEAWILELWEEILEGLQCLKLSKSPCLLVDDPKELHRLLDWVLKLWLITRYVPWDETSKSRLAGRKLDFLYHDLDPTSGLYQRCRKLGLVSRLVSDAAADIAKTTPPKNTRAHLRGFIIRQAASKNVHLIIDGWDKVTLRAKPKKSGIIHIFNRQWGAANHVTVSLEDPFKSEDADVMKLIEMFLDDWG